MGEISGLFYSLDPLAGRYYPDGGKPKRLEFFCLCGKGCGASGKTDLIFFDDVGPDLVFFVVQIVKKRFEQFVLIGDLHFGLVNAV
jgi:hypothetical protein